MSGVLPIEHKLNSDNINKSEEHLTFAAGDYVYHKSWGVGCIISVDHTHEKIIINFEKKNNHSIAMDIAPGILQKLEKDDFRVMMYAQKDVLNNMIEKEPVKLIKLVLKELKGGATVSALKKRLTPDIIPAEIWNKWWNSTKKLLKKDPYIKLTNGTTTKSFVEIRTSPLTYHQEVYEDFISEKNISKKIEIVRNYLSEIKNTEPDSYETLKKIKGFIEEITLASHGKHTPESIECLLLMEELQCFFKEGPGKYKAIVESYLSAKEDLTEFIESITILEYKKQIVNLLKDVRPEKWPEEFLSLFFTCNSILWEHIIKELLNDEKTHIIREISLKVIDQFNTYPEQYLWLCRNAMQGRYPVLYKDVDPVILFNSTIELLNNIFFKIQKGQEGNLKALYNRIKNLLEDKGVTYVKEILNATNADSIFNTVAHSKGLEDWFKISIENIIKGRFPKLFKTPGKVSFLDENKIYVTKEGYEKKKMEFDRLMNVEFAENARDIGEAVSHGDLRENAEYKAAREKQSLLVEKAERLKAELQKVVFIEPHTVHTDIVSPGTKVTLKNKEGRGEIYTILGPWDIDIEKGIISYLSPIGKGLLNKHVGEIATIKLPDGESFYEIVNIERAI